jgi:hypothetical protein
VLRPRQAGRQRLPLGLYFFNGALQLVVRQIRVAAPQASAHHPRWDQQRSGDRLL